jgi:flagellar biosynthetic protein FlhB
MMSFFLRAAFTGELTVQLLTAYVHSAVLPNLGFLMFCGGSLVCVTIITHLLTTQFGFAWKKLNPDFSRLNPVTRLKQLPRQNIPALIHAAALLPLFLLVVGSVVHSGAQEFLLLSLGSVEAGLVKVAVSIASLLWKAAFCLFLLGCVDLFRQRHRHNQTLKMSKQEVKDEHREAEGNPQIKQRIRRLQRDAARRNMMKEIPTATAVIVNPTHYAVAIRFQIESMAAPVVVAKGKNHLAMRIKQKAIDHEVPIVENVPLAQALYKSAEVGQEIPAHLYRAVAEVLAYIFRLMNGKLPG